MKYETYMLQNKDELAAFIALLKAENVKSYLEIGSKFGGSLWQIANSLPVGSRVVAVDLPHGDKSFKNTQPHLEGCVDALKNRRYDAHLFIGSSTDPKIIEAVRKLSPFDVCFIDGNHTEPFIRSDWATYGPMCRLVAFHDIGFVERTDPDRIGKKPIDVPRIWREIKQPYRNREIRLDKRDNGIGIIWMT
jgi:methyltransferase family protein